LIFSFKPITPSFSFKPITSSFSFTLFWTYLPLDYHFRTVNVKKDVCSSFTAAQDSLYGGHNKARP
jgi:hypothetical protein